MNRIQSFSILSVGVCIFSIAAWGGAQDRFAAAQREASGARGVKIVLLGTGTPNPEPERSGAATVIVVDDTPYLIDFGPGVVRRAAAARNRGIQALRVSNIHHAFLTHLHSDHTAGYPDLILSPWVLGRTEPLKVWGPPGLKSMTEHILAAYRVDIDVRLNGRQPIPERGHEVHVTEIEPGVLIENGRVKIEAFAVPHGELAHAFGYKFTTEEGVVVLSGDTGPFEGMVEIARGADVLIHEAYATEGFNRREPVWQAYHLAAHTSAAEVGRIATAADVGMVILSHQLLWGATEEQLLEEVRAHYDGPVVYGRDLDVFDLADVRR